MTQPSRSHAQASTGPIDEALMERDEVGGLKPAGPGWFVVNAADAHWTRDSSTSTTRFQGEQWFPQYGFNVDVLRPGVASTAYHREYWEDETFLVLEGECILLVEGTERPLRAGDLFHSPAGTAHGFVGAGDGPCVMITVGARGVVPEGEEWGIYEAHPLVTKYNAGVSEDTHSPEIAYADNVEHGAVEAAWTPG